MIGRETDRDGTARFRIAIVDLNLGQAGTLPVRPTSPTVAAIVSGMPIPVTTLAVLGYDQGKVRVAAPLPFTLSNEPPNTTYTPAPLRTASPIINTGRNNRNRRRPSPSPSPAASPSGAPSSPAPPAASSAAPASAGTPAASTPTPTAPTPLPAPTS